MTIAIGNARSRDQNEHRIWHTTGRTIAVLAISLVSIACLPTSAHADYTIDATVGGHYGTNDVGGILQVGATQGSYFTGIAGNPTGEARNYFVFDLSQVTGGVSGVTIELSDPANGFVPNVDGISSLTYNLRDASQDAASLSLGGNFFPGDPGYSATLSRFNNLGSGTFFGSESISAVNDGTTLSITLNSAAIASVIAHEGQLLAIGGATDFVVTTSEVGVFNHSGSSGIERLVIHTRGVPEPGSLSLIGIGGLALLGYVRCCRQVTRV